MLFNQNMFSEQIQTIHKICREIFCHLSETFYDENQSTYIDFYNVLNFNTKCFKVICFE
jgi:hypothetical protein